MKIDVLLPRLIRRAKRQGGIITAAEAAEEGASGRQMRFLAESGVFRRLYRGVYCLVATPAGHETAVRGAIAALRGPVAASHSSAAWLQGLVDAEPSRVELTSLRDHRSDLEGIWVHRAEKPFPTHRFRGIACTTPLRTLADISETASLPQLEEAIDRALARSLIRPSDLEQLPPEIAGRRGAGRLRRIASARGIAGGPPPTVLESRFRRLLKRYGIALPEPQFHAGPDGRYRIDYAFADIRLALEAYGFAWHHTAEQLDHDLKRQNQLSSEGWTVLPYTYRQIAEEPQRVAEEIVATYQRLQRLHRLQPRAPRTA